MGLREEHGSGGGSPGSIPGQTRQPAWLHDPRLDKEEVVLNLV